jgi:two-component system chemotaxis sensor kinase CheA
MDIDSIQQIFFQECEEGLQALEGCFASCRENRHDAETINTIFRAVHSIKGGAGAFGFDRLQTFTHHYETVLDQLRSNKLTLTPALLDVLVAALDILADHVGAAQGNGAMPDDAVVLAQLEAVSKGEAAQPAPAAVTEPAAAAEAAAPADNDFDALLGLLAPHEEAEKPAWRVQIKPGGKAMANGGEPLLLLRELARLGGETVALDLADLPALDELDVQRSYLGWTLSVPADVARDDIAAIFEFVDSDWIVEIGEEIEAVAEAEAEPEAEPEPAPEAVLAETAAIVAPPPVATPAAARPSNDDAPAGSPAVAVSPTIRVDLDKLDRLVNLVGELVITQAMLAQRLSQHGLAATPELTSLEHLTRELQESAMSIRAQPMKTVFNRVPRIIRELEADTGKRVRLQLEGEMTEVDKTVVERLGDPLTHLIRNAIDHGLETPEERVAAGKPEEGLLRVAAEHRSGRIVITVADDGRGIDRERVRAKAIERGIIAADATMSDDDVDNLIFAPGFSTAEKVSNISGRGVGMDVVRRSVQALGGRIGVESRFGKGTSFSLSLPLTLAVLDGMIVKVGDQTYVIPVGSVVESLRGSAEHLTYIGDGAALLDVRGQQLPVLPVGNWAGMRGDVDPADTVMIVVESDSGQAVLMVDTIEDQRQVVVKSLEANYQSIPGVAGATILGDGRVALILDADGVIARWRGRRAMAA